jgi:hypothetical protein
MDTKATLYTRTKLNELAAQHNRLTTLCAFLLNEVKGLKNELQNQKKNGNFNQQQNDVRVINTGNNMNQSSNQYNQQQDPNFSTLKAEEILKQLSINNTDS